MNFKARFGLLTVFMAVMLLLVTLQACKNEKDYPDLPLVSFKNVNVTAQENQNIDPDKPYKVTLVFSRPTEAFGSVKVNIVNGKDVAYGSEYTTVPAGNNGFFMLDIPSGTTQITFNLFMIDDLFSDGDKTVTFKLSDVTSDIALVNGGVCTVIIADNEPKSPYTTIVALRSLYAGTVPVSDAITIRGIVTSDKNGGNINASNVCIQDNTAAIQLRFKVPHNFQLGDSLYVTGGGTSELFKFNGLLQMQNIDANTQVVNKGNFPVPAPKIITIAQLKTGDFESQLIQINNISFPDANDANTFNGNRNFTDGVNTSIMRTGSTAIFKNNVLPKLNHNLIGNAGVFNADIQLLPRTLADIQ